MSAAKEFREFILRGNVVDLAVGVIIGGAFGGIVTAFTKDIITPLIGIFGGVPKFDALHFTINKSQFLIGDLINVVIAFLLLAAIVFFLVVKPVNHLMTLMKTETSPESPTRECPYCVSSIPVKATKCAFCTADVPAAPATGAG